MLIPTDEEQTVARRFLACFTAEIETRARETFFILFAGREIRPVVRQQLVDSMIPTLVAFARDISGQPAEAQPTLDLIKQVIEMASPDIANRGLYDLARLQAHAARQSRLQGGAALLRNQVPTGHSISHVPPRDFIK